MSDKKYIVPDGMKLAALKAAALEFGVTSVAGMPARLADEVVAALEAAIRHWSDNPSVPTKAQAERLYDHYRRFDGDNEASVVAVAIEWQRICFLAPEPEVPDAVKDLLCDARMRKDPSISWTNEGHDQAVLEAYRRGKAGK